jgi:outer membrane lipoprotein
MRFNRIVLTVIPILVLAGACSRTDVVPDRLEGQVDRDLRYVEVKDNPDLHRGKLMLAGGKVLSAERLEEGTSIEVLQYPLSKDLIPEERRERSKGRFVAVDRDGKHIIDPAVLEDGRLVTLVGEVLGTTVIKIDEVEERVPKMAIEHVTVWDQDRVHPYYGYGAPYAWGYGPYYGRSLYW